MHLRATPLIIRIAVITGLVLGAATSPRVAAATLPSAAAAGPAYTTRGAWHFVSAPELHPPKLAVLTRRAGAPRRGYFLADTLPNVGQRRPLIGAPGVLLLDSSLRPVWVHEAGRRGAAGDLEQESYRGHPVLVWWEGGLTRRGAITGGLPRLVVVNQQYRTVATLQAASPWLVDAHDAQIVGSDIWVIVLRVVSDQDLAPYGGSINGSLYDYGVQEYNLATGRLLYTWDALNPGGQPHVPLSQSEQPAPRPGTTGSAAIWDPYHLNSIQLLAHHRLLVSMRNTWAVYLIDRATGQPMWTLGGKATSFRLGRGTRFAWQHDARLAGSGSESGTGRPEELTLFNDNCCRPGNLGGRPSEGMILRLSPSTHRVKLVAAYRHNPPLVVGSFGSLQLLPAGKVLIDWGGPYFSEYTRSGKKLLDARWPGIDRSYRTLYTHTWVGTPYYPPSGVVRPAHGRTVVYASWNGGTRVARWVVLAGTSRHALRRVGGHRRTGFETAIRLKRGYRVYEVRALDARGHTLRTSPPFTR